MSRPAKEGLYKRGKIWHCRYYNNDNKLQRKSTGETDPNKAQQVYKTWRESVNCKPSDGKPGVVEVLNLYHEEKGQYSRRNGYEYARQHLLDWFAGVEWERLGKKGDPKRLSKYIQHRQQGKASPGTINIEIGMLSAAANLAIDDGYDIRNHARKKRLTEPRRNYYWLTPEQAGQLLLACRPRATHKSSPHLFDFLVIALGTGMRTSEILTLQRQQVCSITQVIRLPDTKSGEPHEVPMTAEVAAAVSRCLSRSESRWLFFNPKTGKHLVTIAQPLKRAAKRAGIPITDKASGIMGFRCYDTRHTFATWLLQAGASMEDIADLLNHKDPRTTRRYAHHDKGGRKRTLQLLPKL